MMTLHNPLMFHIPRLRTSSHLKYIVLVVAALTWMFYFLSSGSGISYCPRCNEEVPTIEQYINAQKEWLPDLLSDVIKRNGYLQKGGKISNAVSKDSEAADGGADNNDYNNKESDNNDYNSRQVFDDTIGDENDADSSATAEGESSAAESSLPDYEQKAEIEVWKQMDMSDNSSHHMLRKSLAGMIDEILPAPGTVYHEERRPFMILTTVNAGFIDFAVNWLMSLKQIGIRYNVTIIAEDQIAYKYMSNRYKKSPTITIRLTNKTLMAAKPLRFVSKQYLTLVNRRGEYMLEYLEKGFDVLHVDVDEYWFRDPLEFIWAQYDVYDVWSSQGKDGPCPCFLYLKSKPKVISMVRTWVQRMIRLKGRENDQKSLGKILWRYRVMQYQTGMKIEHLTLSSSLFPTGMVFFTPSWWRMHGKRIYVAHANRLGDHEKKTAFFKEYRLWLVNPYQLGIPVKSER